MITDVIVVPRRFASEAQCRRLAGETLTQRLTSGSEAISRVLTCRLDCRSDLVARAAREVLTFLDAAGIVTQCLISLISDASRFLPTMTRSCGLVFWLSSYLGNQNTR